MKKGTKIILIIVGVLILIGLAYYFLVYKPSKASEKLGSNSSGTTTGTSGCVPYTQAQQDADTQKCVSDCQKKPFMQQTSCSIACVNNKKPVKTC